MVIQDLNKVYFAQFTVNDTGIINVDKKNLFTWIYSKIHFETNY